MKKISLAVLFITALSSLSIAQTAKMPTMKSSIYELNEKGKGKKVGYIEVTKMKEGVSIRVVASGIKPGSVGFHMHEKNSITTTKDDKGQEVIGGGLGGHWDPDNTKKHAGPNGDGHRGDLDMLIVNENGKVDQVVTSTRISYEDVKGKSFVIHAMSDNYTDDPVNGGSGARIYAAIF